MKLIYKSNQYPKYDYKKNICPSCQNTNVTQTYVGLEINCLCNNCQTSWTCKGMIVL